jgi:hypothetical protein
MTTAYSRMLPSRCRQAVLVTGLALLFIAERILSSGTLRSVVLGVAALAILAGLARRVQTWIDATHAVKDVERRLLLACAGVALALLVYLLSTDFGIGLLGLKGTTAERRGRGTDSVVARDSHHRFGSSVLYGVCIRSHASPRRC